MLELPEADELDTVVEELKELEEEDEIAPRR